MNSDNTKVFDTDPKKLAEFIDSCRAGGTVWRPDDLAAVLRHQMSAPVQFDLAILDPRLGEQVRLLAASQGLVLNSFRDLFRHPNPPLKLLEMVKDFAKRAAAGTEGPLPREIASVLYYASITAAEFRCQARISKLSEEELRRGLEWALSQSWLDDETRNLFSTALKSRKDAQGGAR